MKRTFAAIAVALLVAHGGLAQSLTISATVQYQNGVDSGSRTFSQTRLLGMPQRLEGVLNATTNWQSIDLTSITNPTPSWVVLYYLNTPPPDWVSLTPSTTNIPLPVGVGVTDTWTCVDFTSVTNPSMGWLVMQYVSNSALPYVVVKYLSKTQTFVNFAGSTNAGASLATIGLGNNESPPGVGGGGGGDLAVFRLNGTNLFYRATTNTASFYYAIFPD